MITFDQWRRLVIPVHFLYLALSSLYRPLRTELIMESKCGVMEFEHQQKIKKNLQFIRDNLDPSDILDHFIEDGIFTTEIQDRIKLDPPFTAGNRNRIFIKYLCNSGPAAYGVFLNALDANEYGFVADRIRATVCDEKGE